MTRTLTAAVAFAPRLMPEPAPRSMERGAPHGDCERASRAR